MKRRLTTLERAKEARLMRKMMAAELEVRRLKRLAQREEKP